MTKIISYDPNSACQQLPNTAVAGTAEDAKGQPSSPQALLKDDKKYMIVNSLMVHLFFVSVLMLWWVDSHEFAIISIVFLYATVMLNLLFLQRHNEAKKKQELQECVWVSTAKKPELTSILMMVATGITLTSLGVMVFLFRPKWRDLAIIALVVSVSTAFTHLLITGLEESERKKALREGCDDALDLV